MTVPLPCSGAVAGTPKPGRQPISSPPDSAECRQAVSCASLLSSSSKPDNQGVYDLLLSLWIERGGRAPCPCPFSIEACPHVVAEALRHSVPLPATGLAERHPEGSLWDHFGLICVRE